MSLEITLLRHGRSRADDENVIEGRYDSPLSIVGREQAEKLADRWLAENIKFDSIIASTLTRAVDTAQIIANTLNLQVELEPEWMEWDNADGAGLTRVKADELFPIPATTTPYTQIFKTGESTLEIHRRAGWALEKLIRRGVGQYLVVSHGGVLNAALKNIVGVMPQYGSSGVHFEFSDTGFAQVSYRSGHHLWTVKTINDTQHLKKQGSRSKQTSSLTLRCKLFFRLN